MNTKLYAKLVRDKIPEIIASSGSKAITYIASNDEYYNKLQKKLEEEVCEFFHDQNKEELADIIEVIHAICEYRHWKLSEIEEKRKKKLKQRGGFASKIILEKVEK